MQQAQMPYMMYLPECFPYAGPPYGHSGGWPQTQGSSWQGAGDLRTYSSGSKAATAKRKRHRGALPPVVGEDGRRSAQSSAAIPGQTLVAERVAAAKKPSKDPLDSLGERADGWKEKLEAGGEQRQEALEFLRGQVWCLAQEPEGSRVVQLAFQDNTPTEQELVHELEHHVREAVSSPHANHVLQKAIEVFSDDTVDFIFRELEGLGYSVACHRYGCRIMVRLMNYFPEIPSVQKLFDDALVKATDLCRHAFGRHVAEIILDKGTDDQRLKVEEALRMSLMENATDRHASYVIEKVFKESQTSTEEVRREFADALLGNGMNNVKDLVQSPFGFYVLKTMLEKLPETDRRPVLDHLEGLKTGGQAKDTTLVTRLLEDLRPGTTSAAATAA